MVTKREVTKREVEKTKNEILLQKMQDSSFKIADDLNPYIKRYYYQLSEKFNKVIIRYMERATNGFKCLPLEEKLKRAGKIKPTIDRLARVNYPNHPHIGIARELAEETFYEVMGIYNSILEKECSLV